MKIHLRQIPDHGLHLEGTEPAAILELHEPAVRAAGDIRYSLDVGLSEGGLFATGTLAVPLDLECVSCLERFHHPLHIPDFACQIELASSESVDLTDLLREDILLALPPHPHCDWSGERVCKGAQLRAKAPADSPAEPDPAEDTRRVWGALDQLKIKKTN